MSVEVRCAVLCLACLTFAFCNSLISDELDRAYGARTDTLDPFQETEQAQIYKGEFRLQSNASGLREGPVRLTIRQQPSAVPVLGTVHVSISFLSSWRGSWLSDSERLSSRTGQSDIQVRAVALAGRWIGSGFSTPGSGLGRCELDSLMDVSGERSPARIDGRANSPDCDVALSFSASIVDVQHAQRKIVYYAVWVNVFTVIQIQCFLSQMRHTSESMSAGRLSMLGIALQAIMDAYDCFLHLSLSASSQSNTFATVALCKFILFALLEVRYLLTIWRHRHQEMFRQGWEIVRAALARIYMRFYAGLIACLILVFHNLYRIDTIAFLSQLYWIPQIGLDVWTGTKNSMQPSFIFGMAISRMAVPLYLWGCPSGIFNGDLLSPMPGAPSSRFCWWILLVQGLQISLMVSQKFFGARWFIPWICLPFVYDYGQRSGKLLPADAECLICMDLFTLEDGAHPALTPCNHRFHRVCLQRWMDIKLECPTCRAKLPPMH